MDINEKFKMVLELQERGVPRIEIYKICGWSSLDTLTRNMKKKGYVYDKQKGKYVQMTCEGHMSSVTNQDISIQGNSVINLKDDIFKDNIIELAKRYKEVVEMLDWYKTVGGQLSYTKDHVIEVIDSGIQIKFPKSDSIKVSIRVDKNIWEQFGVFSTMHREFGKGDLLAQALKEYMDKHNFK